MSSGSRGSSVGVVIAALIALLIGGGGGYGAARFLGGASASDLQSRDSRIAELQQQISDMRFQTDGAQTTDSVLRAQVDNLKSQVASLKRANDTLKKFADEQASQVKGDAQAEIEALQKTIEEAGDLQNQLSRTRKSLKVSELQIIELEGTVKDQQAEIRKLRDDLTKTGVQGDASKALTDQIKTLESALSSAKKQLAAVPDLKRQIATLQGDLADQAADANASARKQIAALEKQKADLQTKLDAAQKLAGTADGFAQQLATLRDEKAELEKNLAASEEQLAGKDSEITGVKARVEQLKRAVDEANGKASTAEALKFAMSMQVSSLNSEKEELETQIAGLKQTIATLQAKPADEQQTDPAPNDNGTTTRDARVVQNALADMPGFSRLAPDRQMALARQLEDGECVADALKSALGRVPAIALRNLIRDLGSRC